MNTLELSFFALSSTLLIMSPIWVLAIYLQIKVRRLFIVECDSNSCPDQINRFYKRYLHSFKKVKISQLFYKENYDKNTKREYEYRKIISDNTFQMFR